MNAHHKDNSGSLSDRKMRWGGLLENPFVSNFQRGILDSGRILGLKKALRNYNFKSVLDVGCGFGESSKIFNGAYCGIDNSVNRIFHAAKKYKNARFLFADANSIPFKDKTFEMSILSNTSHHLTDDQLLNVFIEMKRVSSKYVIINDAIIRDDQSKVSAFFYGLDRGGHYRKTDHMRQIFLSESEASVSIEEEISFWTFPHLYYRTVFICKVE